MILEMQTGSKIEIIEFLFTNFINLQVLRKKKDFYFYFNEYLSISKLKTFKLTTVSVNSKLYANILKCTHIHVLNHLSNVAFTELRYSRRFSSPYFRMPTNIKNTFDILNKPYFPVEVFLPDLYIGKNMIKNEFI